MHKATLKQKARNKAKKLGIKSKTRLSIESDSGRKVVVDYDPVIDEVTVFPMEHYDVYSNYLVIIGAERCKCTF